MPLSIKILSLICAFFFMFVFIYLIRRKSIKPGYCFLWFLISLLMFSVVIFERFFKGLANALHIRDASFLIIVGVLFFLLIYLLYLSIKISEQSDKIQELISHVAILESQARPKEKDNKRQA
jgi:hypothetical protein